MFCWSVWMTFGNSIAALWLLVCICVCAHSSFGQFGRNKNFWWQIKSGKWQNKLIVLGQIVHTLLYLISAFDIIYDTVQCYSTHSTHNYVYIAIMACIVCFFSLCSSTVCNQRCSLLQWSCHLQLPLTCSQACYSCLPDYNLESIKLSQLTTSVVLPSTYLYLIDPFFSMV